MTFSEQDFAAPQQFTESDFAEAGPFTEQDFEEAPEPVSLLRGPSELERGFGGFQAAPSFGSPEFAAQVQERGGTPTELIGTPFDSPGVDLPALGRATTPTFMEAGREAEAADFSKRAKELDLRFNAYEQMTGGDPVRLGHVVEARKQAEDELNAEADSRSIPFRILNESDTPFFQRVTPDEVSGPLPELRAGASNFVASFAEMFKDPLVLAGIGLAKAAPQMGEAIGRGFGLQMLTHSPEQVRAIYEAYKAGDTSAATEAILSLGATAYLGPKLVKGHASPSEQFAKLLQESVKEGKLPDLAAPIPIREELSVNAPKVSEAAEPLKEAAPLPPEAVAQKIPDLLEGERLVTVVRPDGTTYPAAFADKFYDMTSKGMGKIPSIAKIVNGGWSHGAAKAGEKIVEIESAKPEAPLNPGGALKDLSPELQARSNAVKDSMAAEFDRLKAEVEPTRPVAAKEPWEMTRKEFIDAGPEGYSDPSGTVGWSKTGGDHAASVAIAVDNGKPVPESVRAEYPDLAPNPTPAAEVKINGKFQLPSQGPQTFSVLEKLEQTASEKTNGEQIVRVKNDRTGKEEIVLESELRPVKPGVPGVGAKRRTVEDLNSALRKSGMDPSVFPDAKSKANALERAIAKIEEAQVKLRGSRATLSMGVPKAILDVALETIRLSLKAGNSMAKAMAAAVAHIRKEMGEGKFNELEVRNYIADRMLEKPQGTALTDKVEMRTLSERATTSEKIPEPVQEAIKTSPESFYQVQSLKGVEQAAKSKSDAELGATSRDSDAYTADKLELSTRLLNAGKHEEGYRVFQDLSADLTRMGQVINQAKLFQALRPEHVVTVLNKELVKGGRDPLTLEQSARVEAAAQGRITKQSELERATDEWVKNPTDANAARAEAALSDANKAAVDEQSLVNQFKPRATSSVLKSVLQGNLLTPISQVANLVGNVSFIPFRAGTRATATAIDMLDSAIRNRPRQVSAAPVGGTKAAVAGLIQGAKQIPSILVRGTGETIKGEPRAGLHPMRAWVKQFSKNPDVPTVGGKIPFSERINLAIEGTFGVPAEIMLRGLGSGDAPFRGAARGRLISEAARLQKIKPSDQRMAQRFPELFFDKATLERIDSEGRAAIFQRHSSTIDRIMELARSRGDLMDFAIATVAPYKLTPWNIVGEILSYNPLIATARAGIEARRGNTRAAEMNAGKALVGGMTIYAGYWLYENGLLSPSLDSRDEQQKARMLAAEVMPPNHINVSGLKRKLAGGDPEFKSGDETVDIFRGGGLAGSLFYMVANIGRDAETSPPGDEMLLSVLKNSTLEQARFGVNQSFLKGVTGLLDAVRYGETDNYIQSYAGTILSIPLPNTLSALSRAQRQYKVDASDPKFKKQLENLVRTRLGFAGLDDYLPLKRGLWGEPFPETPTNANALVYHFFDISKNKQVTSDPVPLELYRLWRKTASSSVIPTPPEKTITADRETRVLTPAQHSRYAELVGSARRDIVGRVVANPEWHQMPDEGKMMMLEKIYRAGLERGKEEFMIEAWDQLEAKPAKAGFK